MRSAAAALLLAAFALAGCGRSHCDVSDLVVYWKFTDAKGVTRGCTDAGITEVRIYVNGVAPDGSNPKYACDPFGTGVEGITLRSFLSGVYDLQLEGYDAAGQLLYLDQRKVTVAAGACGAQRIDVALAGQVGDLTVTYDFPGACTPVVSGSAGPTTYIWYQLVNASGTVASAADLTQNQTAIQCSDTQRAFVVPQLAFGQYTLRGIEEVQLQADGTTYFVYHYNCVSTAKNHVQDADVLASPAMAQQAVGGTVHCF